MVDPADADHVVATGPDGQIESRDGGATWAAADGPPLVAVSWDRTTGLWGVDGAGFIHRQNASGWTSTGELGGGTHALLATSGMLYSAAFGDDDGMAGIYPVASQPSIPPSRSATSTYPASINDWPAIFDIRPVLQ